MKGPSLDTAKSEDIQKYLLDPSGIDWPNVLSDWSWLLPEEITIWLVNRLGNLFIAMPDDTIYLLDPAAGSFDKIADNREDFCVKVDEADTAEQWFMMSFVDQLVSEGILLVPGQCYGFKFPPIFGGEYTVDNCCPMAVWDYLGACGSIHRQIKDLPDGAKVVLKAQKEPL